MVISRKVNKIYKTGKKIHYKVNLSLKKKYPLKKTKKIKGGSRQGKKKGTDDMEEADMEAANKSHLPRAKSPPRRAIALEGAAAATSHSPFSPNSTTGGKQSIFKFVQSLDSTNTGLSKLKEVVVKIPKGSHMNDSTREVDIEICKLTTQEAAGIKKVGGSLNIGECSSYTGFNAIIGKNKLPPLSIKIPNVSNVVLAGFALTSRKHSHLSTDGNIGLFQAIAVESLDLFERFEHANSQSKRENKIYQTVKIVDEVASAAAAYAASSSAAAALGSAEGAAALIPENASALTIAEAAALTSEGADALTREQVFSLNKYAIDALNDTVRDELKRKYSLTLEEVAALTIADAAALTLAQVAFLTPEAAAALSPEVTGEIDKNFFSLENQKLARYKVNVSVAQTGCPSDPIDRDTTATGRNNDQYRTLQLRSDSQNTLHNVEMLIKMNALVFEDGKFIPIKQYILDNQAVFDVDGINGYNFWGSVPNDRNGCNAELLEYPKVLDSCHPWGDSAVQDKIGCAHLMAEAMYTNKNLLVALLGKSLMNAGLNIFGDKGTNQHTENTFTEKGYSKIMCPTFIDKLYECIGELGLLRDIGKITDEEYTEYLATFIPCLKESLVLSQIDASFLSGLLSKQIEEDLNIGNAPLEHKNVLVMKRTCPSVKVLPENVQENIEALKGGRPYPQNLLQSIASSCARRRVLFHSASALLPVVENENATTFPSSAAASSSSAEASSSSAEASLSHTFTHLLKDLSKLDFEDFNRVCAVISNEDLPGFLLHSKDRMYKATHKTLNFLEAKKKKNKEQENLAGRCRVLSMESKKNINGNQMCRMLAAEKKSTNALIAKDDQVKQLQQSEASGEASGDTENVTEQQVGALNQAISVLESTKIPQITESIKTNIEKAAAAEAEAAKAEAAAAEAEAEAEAASAEAEAALAASAEAAKAAAAAEAEASKEAKEEEAEAAAANVAEGGKKTKSKSKNPVDAGGGKKPNPKSKNPVDAAAAAAAAKAAAAKAKKQSDTAALTAKKAEDKANKVKGEAYVKSHNKSILKETLETLQTEQRSLQDQLKLFKKRTNEHLEFLEQFRQRRQKLPSNNKGASARVREASRIQKERESAGGGSAGGRSAGGGSEIENAKEALRIAKEQGLMQRKNEEGTANASKGGMPSALGGRKSRKRRQEINKLELEQDYFINVMSSQEKFNEFIATLYVYDSEADTDDWNEVYEFLVDKSLEERILFFNLAKGRNQKKGSNPLAIDILEAISLINDLDLKSNADLISMGFKSMA